LEYAHRGLVDVYANNSTIEWTLKQNSAPPYPNLYTTSAAIERQEAHEQLANDIRDAIRGTGPSYWTDKFIFAMSMVLTVDYIIYHLVSVFSE
jgi:hypothetical protein